MKLTKILNDVKFRYAMLGAGTSTLVAVPAMAQTNVGDLAKTWTNQFADLLTAVYTGGQVIGAISLVAGIMKFKEASKPNSQTGYGEVWWKIGVGVGLLTAGTVMKILRQSALDTEDEEGLRLNNNN